MEQASAKDGVYTGRYVLVEYDENRSVDLYPSGFYRIGDVLYRGWMKNEEGFLIPTD
ncbi:MAG: hypothetical protein J6I85_05680 [Clostridia bacterium]|nr:hypothetical protein [Clostridia bacterium]